MINNWDLMYDVIFAPRQGMQRIASQSPLVQAACLVAAVMMVPILLLEMIWQGNMPELPLLLLGSLLSGVFTWLLWTALWHLSAELVGGRGSVKSLLAATGYAHLPIFFFLPLSAVVMAMSGTGQSVGLVIGLVVLTAWCLWLDVEALAAVYGFSRSKAILVLLSPCLLVVCSLVVITLAVGVQVAMKGGVL